MLDGDFFGCTSWKFERFHQLSLELEAQSESVGEQSVAKAMKRYHELEVDPYDVLQELTSHWYALLQVEYDDVVVVLHRSQAHQTEQSKSAVATIVHEIVQFSLVGVTNSQSYRFNSA